MTTDTNWCIRNCEDCELPHTNKFETRKESFIVQLEFEPTEEGCNVYYPPSNHPKYNDEGYEGWGLTPQEALMQLVKYWNDHNCDFSFPFIILQEEQ